RDGRCVSYERNIDDLLCQSNRRQYHANGRREVHRRNQSVLGCAAKRNSVMAEIFAFNPLYINTGLAGSPAGTLIASTTLAATTSAQAVILPGGNSSCSQIQIANQTTAWAYVNFGIAGSVTA